MQHACESARAVGELEGDVLAVLLQPELVVERQLGELGVELRDELREEAGVREQRRQVGREEEDEGPRLLVDRLLRPFFSFRLPKAHLCVLSVAGFG